MKQVEIKIKGHLDADWQEWLGDLEIQHTGGETSLLTGCVPDEAAVYGLVAKLRDLGVTLISIEVKEKV